MIFKKIINFFKGKNNKKKKYKIIPIFVPHLGCPEDCVFCNQVKIAGAMPNIKIIDAKNIIEEHLESIEKKKDEDTIIEIAFFGGSFTAIDEDFQNELLELANEYIRNGRVDGIRISTRPDKITKEILIRLKKYNVTTIELGIQSSNDFILENARRGHDFKSVIDASKLIKKYKINFGAQMMIGLPGTTYKDEIQTAKDIIKLKPKMVRIYPTLVIKNTDLEDMYNKGEYIPLELEEAVEVTAEIVNMFKEKDIEVIRVGLQTTEEICDPKNKNSEVVAGPYHENFRELVDARIWYHRILEKILKMNVAIKEMTITVNYRNAGAVLGHKKENIRKFKENYGIDVNVEYKTALPLDDFELEIKKDEPFDIKIIGEKK